MSKNISEKRQNIITDYILARKLFRPRFEAVNKLKEETIYNIKNEEDENN